MVVVVEVVVVVVVVVVVAVVVRVVVAVAVAVVVGVVVGVMMVASEVNTQQRQLLQGSAVRGIAIASESEIENAIES